MRPIISHVNKGMIAEMRIALHLVERGWEVYRPLTVNGPVDLVIKRGGVVHTVECKAAKGRAGADSCRLEVGLGPEQIKGADYIGVYIPDTDEICFFRADSFDISNRNQARRRAGGTRHNFRVDHLTGVLDLD